MSNVVARSGLGIFAILLGIAAVPSSRVEGQGRLSARVFLVQAQIPGRLSERAMLGFARGHQSSRLVETQEPDITQRAWIAQMVTSFNHSPNDLEFHVLFYDTEEGGRRFVDDMSTFVNDRAQRTFVQRLRLRRPQFRPNRRMELVVTVDRQEVGRLAFAVLGEEARRTGEVSFTDDER